MKRYLSLHIGVNEIDRASYGMMNYKTLYGCLNDASAMADVACTNGFTVMGVLKNESATFEAVAGAIQQAIAKVGNGGIFLLTFSGHGAQLPTRDSNDEYKDDEGFVLYDIVMKDNYLNVFLRQFQWGSRVIIVADCCHSRTIYSFGKSRDKSTKKPPIDDGSGDPCRRNRRLNLEEVSNKLQKKRYEDLDTEYRNKSDPISRNINADVLVLSACDDNELAADGPEHGAFTQQMLDILRSGCDRKGIPFSGSYRELIDEIRLSIGNAQVPQITPLGPNKNDNAYPFFQGPPFTLFK